MPLPLETSRKRSAKPQIDEVSALAARPDLKEALAWFGRERKWIDEQHLALCRIPAPTFREEKRAEWVSAQFRSLGWDAKIDRAGNVVATLGAGTRPLVALTAHLDTVLSASSPEEIRFDGNRFLGPGVSDNGAGLAALIALARLIPQFGFGSTTPAAVLLAANVGEEGEGNLSGMRFLCRQSSYAQRIRSFLVLDGPAADHITAEALACRRFEVIFQGPGGHSWSDFGTANPVNALCRAIADFADLRAEGSTGSGRMSFNFGVIEGGSTINAIPAQARAKTDLRAADPALLDEMVQQLARTLERSVALENGRSTGGRVSAKMRETGSRPGGSLPPDAPILATVKAVDEFLGLKSFLDCASTDANVPLSLGLPAVSIGAGGQGGGAHTPGEWYSPEGRELGLRRILLTLGLLLEEPAAGAA
jgi:acetylornithine deacetylase/succinyl-diaminopimelate desuccinylase-like protein